MNVYNKTYLFELFWSAFITNSHFIPFVPLCLNENVVTLTYANTTNCRHPSKEIISYYLKHNLSLTCDPGININVEIRIFREILRVGGVQECARIFEIPPRRSSILGRQPACVCSVPAREQLYRTV